MTTKRMQLSAEEITLIEEFRAKTAVLRAWREGFDTALAIVETKAKNYPSHSPEEQVISSIADDIRRHRK